MVANLRGRFWSAGLGLLARKSQVAVLERIDCVLSIVVWPGYTSEGGQAKAGRTTDHRQAEQGSCD